MQSPVVVKILQERISSVRETTVGISEGLSETVTHKLRPTGIHGAQRGEGSIAGESPQPKINLESLRNQKTI